MDEFQSTQRNVKLLIWSAYVRAFFIHPHASGPYLDVGIQGW